MNQRILISISTVSGSKSLQLSKRTQQFLRWSGYGLLVAVLAVAGSILYLLHDRASARGIQAELEVRSGNLEQQLSSLQSLKADLEQDLDERESRLAQVSDRLLDIENVLGVHGDGEAPIEARLDLAAVNSAVRHMVLEQVPNGSPVKNARQSSQFGFRTHPVTGRRKMHRGLDFAVNTGTPIYAPADGVVEVIRPSKSGSGNFLKIEHAFGFSSSYSHLQKFVVRSGDFVNKHDLIAYSGNTGLSSGPHLHYEIRFIGRALDPRPFVDWNSDNFESIFEQERIVKWASLINKVQQRVSLQLQLSSHKDATSKASSS
ncbi:peptidase M23 [Photobacterium sanctipauli]|uniref:Peptidase M23 n=1 Tax=Photobacterium sanctipauli TaxID=1342794 RepID=A0A2T3NPM8_9GAMM|nr:M23 family metallopeptidase [Photobacterium sanctipauli]PSW18225.1 peptidase M23 [Photobacterium sanctipauli]